MAICRHREEPSQSPTTGRGAFGWQANGRMFLSMQLFSSSRVHKGQHQAPNEPRRNSKPHRSILIRAEAEIASHDLRHCSTHPRFAKTHPSVQFAQPTAWRFRAAGGGTRWRRLIFVDATFGVSPTSKKPNQNPSAIHLL